jgi:predicted peroxiredoxin
MGDAQRFMLIGLAGPENPTRASLLFAWANALAEAGHTVRLDLAGEATNLIRSEVTDSLAAPGFPDLKSLIAKAQDHGVPLYLCRSCALASPTPTSKAEMLSSPMPRPWPPRCNGPPRFSWCEKEAMRWPFAQRVDRSHS